MDMGLYKERSLLTANGKDIKNEEVLTLLDAVWEPERVAVIHCWGHQKEDTPRTWGNKQIKPLNKQPRAWGMTSETPVKALVLVELPELTLVSPKCTEGAIKTERGWWELPSGKLLVPEELAPTLVSQTHQATHLGHDKLEELIQKYFLVLCLSSLCRTESQNCTACSQVNAASWHRQKPRGFSWKACCPLDTWKWTSLKWNLTSLSLLSVTSCYVLRRGRNFSYPAWKNIRSSLVPA